MEQSAEPLKIEPIEVVKARAAINACGPEIGDMLGCPKCRINRPESDPVLDLAILLGGVLDALDEADDETRLEVATEFNRDGVAMQLVDDLIEVHKRDHGFKFELPA